jgi:hypothetical protein
MAKTRRRQQPSLPKIHVREATDLPINSQVAVAEVDDPYELGAKITVIRSIRDDPLARLYMRSQIDTAQFSAGREYQRLHRIVELGGAQAIDPAKEFVDGGKFMDLISDERIKATKALAAAYQALGQVGSNLVVCVLGHGMMVKQYAVSRGANTERQVRHYSDRIRECLETMALLWGYAGKKR